MSKQKLNLLILEDNPDDAELMVRELEKEGFVLEWERVDTEKEFKKALAKNPEIILADYNLPSYNGIAALKLQQKTVPDIPLIIVSGTIGEELAVECLKAGATDYVLKNRLSRLSPMVKRALKEAEERNERKQAEKELSESEQKFRTIFNNANDGIIYLNNLGRIIDVNKKAVQLFGGTKEELINKHFTKTGIFSAKYIQNILNGFKKTFSNKKFIIDITITNTKGKQINLECSSTKVRQEGKTTGIIVIARDITEYKQSEEILRKSEEKYHLITESTSDVISLHTFDLDAVYTYASPSVKTLSGYEPDELIDKSCLDFVHPEDKKILLPLLQKYIRSKIKSLITRKKISVKETFEYRIKNKSGKWRYVQSTGNIMGDQLLFVSRDITKNKQTEEALRESEKKYRNLVEKLEEGIASVDENENFIFINNAVSKILGYPKKELLNKSLKDFTTPDEFKKVIEQTSVRKKGKSSKYEINIIKKDGSCGVISTTTTPLFDDNKKYTGSFGIIQDITERKQAQEALRESEAKFRELSELLPQIVYEIDEKGKLTFVNKVAFDTFGYSHKDFDKGVNIFQMMIPEERKRAEQNIHRVLSGEIIGDIEYTALKKDGTSFPVLVFASPIFSGEKLIGLRGIIIDITERKKAEEQLKKKNTELEAFNKLTIGRELRMIELKGEINELLKKLGQEDKYKVIK